MPLWFEVVLVLAALYVSECVFWIPFGTAALVGRFGDGAHPLHPGPLRTSAGGLQLGPLLPTGFRLLVRHLPFCIDPVALAPGRIHSLFRDDYPRTAEALSLDTDARPHAEGRDLRLGRAVVGRAGSATEARRLSRCLEGILDEPADRRDVAIRHWLSVRMDVETIRERFDELRCATRSLRGSVTFLSLYLFALLPLSIATGHAFSRWTMLGIGWLVLLSLHAVLYARAHRRLHPGEGRSLVADLAVQTLSPVAAVFSHVHLTRRALEDVDPLAATAALANRASFRDMARWTLAAAPPERCGTAPDPAPWFDETVRAVISDELLEPGEERRVTAPPERHEPSSRAYCPRCLDQYRVADRSCEACGGLPLVPFPPPVPESSVREGIS